MLSIEIALGNMSMAHTKSSYNCAHPCYDLLLEDWLSACLEADVHALLVTYMSPFYSSGHSLALAAT